MMKKLSFIIPLYNSAQWLRKCLDSALNQDINLSELEIICINDGSPDNSADIAREYQSKYPGTFVVLDQENQGPSGARNNGMRHASGKYLCFLDPDDYLIPYVYKNFIEQMEEENLDMLRFNFQTVDEDGNILPIVEEERLFNYSPQLMNGKEFIADRLRIGCNIWRYMYRTAIIQENNIWCFTGDYYDDTPWLPLVLFKVKRLNISRIIAYNYLERENGLVKISTPQMIERKIDGNFLLLQLLKEQKSYVNDKGVLMWYNNVMSHSVLSLLSLVACYKFNDRNRYLKKLKEIISFPLIYDNKPIKKSRKLFRLINLSPSMYMIVQYLKKKYF